MGLKVIDKQLNGLVLFEPNIYSDDRGFFMESFKSDEFLSLGLPEVFKQDNHSGSVRNVLRGMHFQWDKPQGKLIRVTVGSAIVVELDIRTDSDTLGKAAIFELSAENKNVLWVPPGFANGFLAKSDWVEMQYKCTELWNRDGEGSILWCDPELNINWGIDEPLVSPKDKEALTLKEWLQKPESKHFKVSN